MADPSLAPPIIQGEGAKVQSDWLFAFLKAPKTGQIRPWLEVHMPTFGFTAEELNDLTRYFAALDSARYPFDARDYVTDPQDLAAGRKTFELLRCKQCHPRNEQEMNAPGVDRASLAPNLQMASSRLRHDWINDWIRRPDEWMPGTRMPTNFPTGDDGQRISPIAGMFDAPAFAKDRRGVRPDPGRRRRGEGLPLEPRRRDEGVARLRVVGRRQRRHRSGRVRAGSRAADVARRASGRRRAPREAGAP